MERELEFRKVKMAEIEEQLDVSSSSFSIIFVCAVNMKLVSQFDIDLKNNTMVL